MPQVLIAFIVVATVVIITILKGSADVARTKSDEIMEQSNAIDKDLQKNNGGFHSLNKINIEALIKANK